MSGRRKTPRATKRRTCHVCNRRRLRKFVEWHPGVEAYQCLNWRDCDAHAARRS